MSQPESTPEPVPPEPPTSPRVGPRRKWIARGLTLFGIVGVLIFVCFEIGDLWQAWSLLRREQKHAELSEVIGYRDIGPVAAYAEAPRDWFRDNGNQSLLWSRWEHGVGHQWFHFTPGDLDRARLLRPDSQMVSRPIDFPLVENDGGEIWERIPPNDAIVGVELLGHDCVYPLIVLGKVQVINDVVEDHPFLIVANLFAQASDAVSVFDADMDGRRVTMATSGYFHDQKPLLFDRGTESLWYQDGECLRAVAGKHKGTRLPRVARPGPVAWQTWLSKHHQSRLLVGADRTRGIPHE